MAHAGVVTFHRLEKNLTRVMVDMDFVPQGMIEKMASGMRFVKRAVEADLARFNPIEELAVVRMIHATGMVGLEAHVRFSEGMAEAARTALEAGAPILCDFGVKVTRTF